MGVRATLIEVLNGAIDARLQGVHVACPGNVIAYDRTKQQATIQPGILQPYFDDEAVLRYAPFAPLEGVPVRWPRVGQAALHGDLAFGDSVEMVFHDMSIGEWRMGQPNAEPADVRKLSFGYPIARPGLYPDTNPLQAPGLGFTIGYQGAGHLGRILFAEQSVQIGEGVGQALVTKADLVPLLAALQGVAAVVATITGGLGAPPTGPMTTAANAAKAAADAVSPVYTLIAKGV